MAIHVPRPPSFGEQFGQQLGAGLGAGISAGLEKKTKTAELLKENAQIEKDLGIKMPNISDPELRKAYVVEQLKGMREEKEAARKRQFVQEIQNKARTSEPMGKSESSRIGSFDEETKDVQQLGEQPLPYTEDEILAAEVEDHALAQGMRARNESVAREQRENIKANQRASKEEQRKYEANRAYETQFSKKAEEEVEAMRNSLPKLSMAFDYARNSVETGELDFFSKDKLADILGIDAFRTAKGAQLITAGKENLLGNMSRVSSKAQNIWFEQRLNSMFPKIGQSREANLTVQEMLEGEVAMNMAYVNEFDRLVDQDMHDYGFVKKDINKRARNASQAKEKEILKRTSYRMREIEEQEQGLEKLKKHVGKNVIKDTPLTIEMAKLYKKKFGENGIKVAKKNGYFVPNEEEFMTFRARPSEFREGLKQEAE